MEYKNAVKNIRQELENYILQNQIKSLVLGVSGGIDSALVAALAKPVCDNLDIPLIGRSITIESNKQEEIDRAEDMGKYFCYDFKEIDLTTEYQDLTLSIHEDIPENMTINSLEYNEEYKIHNGNIKARLRMTYLHNLASRHKGMVLSTDNSTEYLLGFWTLNDVGNYGMIQSLWKSEVYDMAEWIVKNESLSLLEQQSLVSCIEADATDGLGITDTDLDQIMPSWKGSSKEGYNIVDLILIKYIERGIGDLDDPVIHRHLASEFKRKCPINIPRNKIEA